MTRYSINPVEEKFQAWDLEYKKKRNLYWARLRTAFRDYMKSHNDGNFDTFRSFMEDHYGLEVSMTGGNIESTYKIIDESKYTMFVLKYGE